MNEPIEDILSDAVDGVPRDSSERIEPLEPAALSQVASELVVHGLLCELGDRDSNQDEQRIDRVMDEIGGGSTRRGRRHASAGKRSLVKITSSLLAVAAALAVIAFLAMPKGDLLAAAASVETMLSAAQEEADRTYRVHVVDEYTSVDLTNDKPGEIQRKNGSVDDATLVVRGLDKFVLIHSPVWGAGRVSGCDGEQSWSFYSGSPVHVSADLNQFRNSLPGDQNGLPMLNIQKHLEQLKAGYRLTLLAGSKTGRNGETLSQLTGVKKSKEIRGPREIEIWFDESEGSIHWMLLNQLPRESGGPKSILLELVGQLAVADEFYAFQFHDALNRDVVID
ncbi:MAG: hypothetical protein GY748_13530 [Planctomycetaceae bacterium]|nr:hypothetical protein [Planctomycetaceae bacterium]